MNTQVKPADVFLTRGRGLLSRAIRFFTRRIGEGRTKVNHVGIVVQGGSITEAKVVEALSKVVEHPLVDQYGPKSGSDVAIYRPLKLTEREIITVVKAARGYVGREYGYFQLLFHFLDWVLQGAYVFRRLGMDNYPICSWVVAHSFSKAGKTFGVAPGAATPDDIWDFVTTHLDRYQAIHPLGPLAS